MTIISFFSVFKRKVISVKTCHAPSPFIENSVMPFNRHIDLFQLLNIENIGRQSEGGAPCLGNRATKWDSKCIKQPAIAVIS